jgi:DNA-binding PadR family transcriptional regulator
MTSIWYLVPIALISVVWSFVSSWRSNRNFDSNRRQLVLQVLQQGSLTENDIVDRDHQISPEGVITHHLQRMTKEGLIDTIERENGNPKYALTDKGRHVLHANAPLPTNSTEAA